MHTIYKLLLSATLLTSIGIPAQDVAPEGSTAQMRMESVIQNLGPAVEINGRPRVRASLAEEMKTLHVPGVAIAVIRGGKIDWAKGFGLTGKGGEAVTADTLFQAGSVSKPIAAMTALHLVQQGRLPLDTDVNATLTAWRLPQNNFVKERPVTLRALLSHTAGTTVHGFDGYASGVPVPTLLQVLNGDGPANSPAVVVDQPVGQAYRYSGGGYEIAQQMMIDATGTPFAKLVHDEVLAPLDMTRSTEQQPLDAALLAHAALPHDATGAAIAGGPHTYPEMAAAGLWTTANDLAKFVMDLQHAASGKRGQVLDARTAKQMMTVVKGTYALGVNVLGSTNSHYFFHDGSNAGYKATMLGYLRSGDGVVVLTNGDQGYELGEKITRAVAIAYGWPDLHPVERTAVDLRPEQLDPYAGTFDIAGIGSFTIRRHHDELVAEIWKGVGDPMYALGPGRFFITSHDLVLTFDGPDRGSVAMDDFKGTFKRAKP